MRSRDVTVQDVTSLKHEICIIGHYRQFDGINIRHDIIPGAIVKAIP